MVYLEYYFQLMTDAHYLNFALEAVAFLGLVPTFTATNQDSLLAGPSQASAVHYMAHLGASKMTNLSSWFYRAGAGNKNVDKAVIATAFSATMKEEYATAEALRNEIYTREGQREAPGYGVARTPFPSYTPRR